MENKKDLKNGIFLVDGSSFLYRAYYSLPPMHTKTGQPVQVVFGFCRMIKKLINKFNPSYLTVVWDHKENKETVRHQMFEEYKEQRDSSPIEINAQRDLVKKFLDIINLKQIERTQTEADDILFSLAKDFEKSGKNTILVTSDKDMRQAVSDNVFIFDPFKNLLIDKEYINKRYGIPVEKLIFYFALIGDAIDNIPGVKGIGPKAAEKIVLEFDSLEDLYNNLDKIEKPRIRQLLESSKENAFLSEKLFKLYNQNLEISYDNLKFDSENWKNAKDFFEDLDFKSLLKEIAPEKVEKKSEPVKNPISAEFVSITDLEKLKTVCEEIKNAGACAIDTETDGLDAHKANMVGLSVCTKPGKAYYIPTTEQFKEPKNQNAPAGQMDLLNQIKEVPSDTLSKKVVIKYLKPIFEDKNIKKYLHHAKFDRLILSSAGIEVQGTVFDTLIAASLVTKEWQRINLKWLSEFYLNQKMLTYKDVVTKEYKDFSEVPIELATKYAAADAHQTFCLVEILQKKLEENNQLDLFENIEMPLSEILYQMEKEGISVDREKLNSIGSKVSKEIEETEQKIKTLLPEDIGKTINLNSPKQLEELLFDKLRLTPIKKTSKKTGFSTDQEVLAQLAKIHPVPGLIIKYRELSKLKSTYIEGLKVAINPKTQKIHTSFSQTIARTGRLSSSEPNLQNVPVENIFQIRSAFITEPETLLLSADYSQIELRVLAYLSQDKRLLEAFKNQEDIHTKTASGLFDVPIEEVDTKQRNIAKRINFSIIYGVSAYGLSHDLNLTNKEAQMYIEKYFAQYPEVVRWMAKTVQETKEKGYVETLWGRRRDVPGIYEKNRNLFELAKRIAINTAVQGTAAELMKIGMLNLSKKLIEKNFDAKILLQIHDELILKLKEPAKEQIKKITKETLESVANWNIPLIISSRTGKTWQELTK